MLVKLRTLALAAACLAATAAPSQAASIYLDSCDAQGCQGLTLFMMVTDNSGSFDVELTYNADNYTGTELGLNQVGFKAISNWTSVALDSSPTTGWLDPPVQANTSSNNLCTTGTSSDKVCTHGFVDITSGGNYTFNFTVTGGTLLSETQWHIGGQFANAAGISQGQIISAGQPIPEPGALLVFATGLAVVSPFVRRRRA